MSRKALIPLAVLTAAVCAGAYAQTSTTPSPYKPGEIVTTDTAGSQVLIISCGLKNAVQQCSVRHGRNGEFGNGEAEMWVMDIIKGDNAVRAARGLAPRTAAGGASPVAASAPAPGAVRSPVAAGRTAPAAAATPVAGGGRCTPATPYVGAIPASRAPSRALFQQLIANKFTADGNARYPRSVQFLSFAVGPLVTNRVGATAQGANRVNNGAPVGAQMTTIKTSFTVCREEYSGKSRYDSTYFCWKGASEWACGVSESQVSTLR